MNLQSSFIFLNNTNEKSGAKSKKEIVLPKSIILYIKELFGACETDKGNFLIKRKYECLIDKCKVLFTVSSITNATYLNVCVEGKRNDNIVKCLEKVQQKLDNSKISDEYVIITAYCAVSEYYCNKLYPRLNELERNLRSLLLHIYILKFDNNFYSHCMDLMSEETQETVKRVMQSKNETKRKKNLFYSMDFGQLQELLFTQKWTEEDDKAKQLIVDNPDATCDEFRDFMSNIGPKSEWERIFSDKIETDFAQKNIQLVAKKRNKVAHTKLLSKEEFIECNKIIDELNKEIEIAIEFTQHEEFIKANEEAISQMLSGVLITFSNFIRKTVKPMDYFFKNSGVVTMCETLGKIAIDNYNSMNEQSD